MEGRGLKRQRWRRAYACFFVLVLVLVLVSQNFILKIFSIVTQDTNLSERRHFPTMDGKTIFKLAVQKLPEVVNEALEKAELALDDIDLFIPHQANLRINQFFQKSMKLPEGKVFNNIQRYGNTTAASIPIALDEAIEMNLIGDGSTVLFLGLGSGLTWGAVISKLVG